MSHDEIHYAIGESSIGLVLVARSDDGLTTVLLGTDRDALRRELEGRLPRATLVEDATGLTAALGAVVAFIERPARDLDLPLDLRGTPFQQTVWKALREVPTGSTATYADIANRIGRPTSARAVAQACAANPLAVVVPCHRVVRSDGNLSGYRWGVERKRALLEREAGA